MRLRNRSAETDVDVWSWHHPSTAPFVNRAARAHDKAAATSAVLVPTVVSLLARRHGADSTSVIAAAASRSLQRARTARVASTQCRSAGSGRGRRNQPVVNHRNRAGAVTAAGASDQTIAYLGHLGPLASSVEPSC